MKISKSFVLLGFIIFIIKYTAIAQPDDNKPPIKINELIDVVSDSLNRHYIFPDKSASISAYLHSKAQSNTYAGLANDPQKLARQITVDISSIQKDPHLRIKYDPGFMTQAAYHPTAEEILQAKNYWKENNYSFKRAEWLPGNIGYVSFNMFVDDIEAAKPTIKAALTFVKNADALIIDLRENMGGDPKMVSQTESYFFKEKTEMNSLINRSANDTIRLYADPDKTDDLYLSMPVYILTSKNTFSGAEDFCYGMQVAKRAVVVGEITGGGAHPQMPFSIGQGFVAYIPFARSLNPVTKTDWEGTGVIPDERTSAAQALMKAQELIFRSYMAKTQDQKIKNRSQYYLNALTKTGRKELLPVKKLSLFTGTYGGLVMYLAKGKLFCRNNNNGGTISALKQLSNNLFILDRDAQVEFIKDNGNQFSKIKILVSDGTVFEEKKLSEL